MRPTRVQRLVVTAVVAMLAGRPMAAQPVRPCDVPALQQGAALASGVILTSAVLRDTLGVRHCEVIGRANERTAADGQRYAIGFRLRLPTQWNGRFLFQGGGGTDGILFDALGPVAPGLPTGLERGFAVVATDGGHDNARNTDPLRNGAMVFGFDYEARVDWGERAVEVSARAGQALVTAYYGRAASHAYFVGCSNGGRQGMVAAERFPELFDGIVAGAPAFALPTPNYASAWDTQRFGALARDLGEVDPDGTPRINRTYSDEELALVATAVLEACDALDGAADGMVHDVMGCTTARVEPRLRDRRCTGPKAPGCLLEAQIATLLRSMRGPRRSDGAPLYAEWPWDAGMGGRIGAGYQQGWRIWKLGAYAAGRTIPYSALLAGPAQSAVMTTPAVVVPDNPLAYQAFFTRFNFDRDPALADVTTPDHPRSVTSLISARNARLTAFRARGGKLLIPHGMSDPIFSFHDTRQWWEALDQHTGGNAADFVRLYAVPGMAHCGGGPATDRYDCLDAVVRWVEQGAAPDRIVATAGPGTDWPGRSRPLCPWPSMARYRGTGSLEVATSFACVTPPARDR